MGHIRDFKARFFAEIGAPGKLLWQAVFQWEGTAMTALVHMGIDPVFQIRMF